MSTNLMRDGPTLRGEGRERPALASRSRRWPVAAFIILVLSCGDGAVEPPATPPPVPTTVTVSPATAPLSALGETARFTAEVRDQNGQGMAAASVAWASSDASVASVDDSGLVTAAANGTATITARASSASGTAAVTVAQVVSAVAVSPPADTLVALGDTVRLTAEAEDANGHAVDGAVFSWSSSDAGVARVDEAGLVEAVAAGAARIRAAVGDVSGVAEITVESPDRAVLVAFYEATDGPNWVNNEGWLTNAPVGTWHGVGATEDNRVYSLRLYSNGLAGSIPAELEDLALLTQLVLANNELTGPIPPELGNLANLRWVGLSRNQFTGSIPPELGDLAELTSLGLSGNQLTGSIPPEFGNLGELTVLGLSYNRLTGPIPAELGNLASLERLFLSDNQLTGPIPESLLDLARLTYIAVNRNDGLCAPGTRVYVDWIAELDFRGKHCNDADFTVLQLLHETAGVANRSRSDGWGQSAALGEWYGVTADSLGYVVALDLSGNGLSGRLPATLGALTRMTRLHVDDNELSGRLPSP